MRPSLRLGTISGIHVGIHWSAAAIVVMLLVTLSGGILPEWAPGYSSPTYAIVALVSSAMFLGSIVAHELGHSLVAQRGGIKVKAITLFALGGVAQLESEPDNAPLAARIALAGPAVSILIGAISLGTVAAVSPAFPPIATAALGWLGIINIGLGVLNMIPALPLDGGRLLQSILWAKRGDRLTATISAAKVGRLLGNLIMLFGLWQFASGGGGLWTAMIGWFVSSTARSEMRWARHQLRQREMGAAGVGWPFGQGQMWSWYSADRGAPANSHEPVDVDVIEVEVIDPDTRSGPNFKS